jgi:uncharacterized membrane protein YjjP (DUF1212 family)
MQLPPHLIAVANSVATSHENTAPDDCTELLVTLAESLHRVGQPSHRLEETMCNAARQLDRKLQIFALPTGLILSFEDADGHDTRLTRMEDSGIHLERLSRLSCAADRIVCGKLDPVLGKVQIERIMNTPDRWGPVAIVAAYLLSAAAFSVFFGGGWIELITASAVGITVGTLSIATRSVRASRRLFELSSALAAAWIASIVDASFGHFVSWIPLAAGLIILLPGMATVDSVEELSSGHLVSGGARLAGVAVVFLAMTFGAILGLSTADLVSDSVGAVEPIPLPAWVLPVALVAVSVGSMIRFRASVTDLPSTFAASVVAYTASRIGANWLGSIAGAFLAALVLGALANLVASRLRQPVEMLVVPGLAILVPGSIGVRSLSSLLSQDTTSGVDAAFQMFVTAMAIVAGLLFSNSIARRRGVF